MIGSIPGRDTTERTVYLAGALAELGVTRLTLTAGKATTEHAARETDLPALIEAALASGRATLETQDPDIHVELSTDRFAWSTDDERAGAHLASL